LAADGLIDVNGTTVPSIAVRQCSDSVRDYLGSVRFDWAESRNRSGSADIQDSYLTQRLVQQATLPHRLTRTTTTGTRDQQCIHVQSDVAGNLVLGASLLHLTQTRNSDLGFALQFPLA